MSKAKPEEAYFFEADGDRVAVFIINIQSNDRMSGLIEPLFQAMGAKVEVHPVMNFEELKKEISRSFSK